LRGVAVLTVMLFHATLNLAGGPRPLGGFLGVDIFFVLSGFLITALLLQEWERTGAVNLKAFYARRALRLLPALFTLLGVVLLVPGLFYRSEPPWGDVLVVALYASNWFRVFGSNLGFLGHTWSLTIEEQFYVIWPVLLVLLLTLRVRRRWILFTVILGVAISSALRVELWAGPESVRRLYYGLDTRFGSLLLGCLAGLVAAWNLLPRTERWRTTIRLASGVSALALSVLLWTADEESRATYYGLSTIACTAVGVIVLHLLYCPSKLTRVILENRPLLWVGRLSYSLYLWHVPVFSGMLNSSRMAKLGISGLPLLTLRFAVAFVVASLSFYLIEQPFLRIKRRFASSSDPDAPASGAPARGSRT
jgi:peptidoglycan/LPS O-acetylase OafA/YrhL